MKKKQSLRVLIGTVGGQGGGVLSDWLIHGLLNANWNAVSIGLLGLSQRAGTVTYYCEASSDKESKVVNSMFAVPGDVNLFIGQELLELGRLLSSGYASEDCVIVGNLGRTYTTLEKMPSEAGVYDSSIIVEAAESLSPSNNYLIDAPAFVTANNLQNLTSNAFLLGVVVASKVIDLPPDPFVKAIEDSEVNVKGNIQAFHLGYRMFKEGKIHPGINQMVEEEKSTSFPDEKKSLSTYQLPELILGKCSEQTIQLIRFACDRLENYQDKKYVQSYLQMIEEVQGQKQVLEGTVNAFVKNAALWLCYEDIPRVGQLKTDPDRYRKVFKEHGIGSRHVVKITDFFVPDVEQLVGMLPKPLASIVKRAGVLFSSDFENKSFPLRIQSTSILGYWSLRLLAIGRYWRRSSLRHQTEMQHFNYWFNSLKRVQDQSPVVAEIVAELGRVVKGYGHVRVKAINDVYVFIDKAIPHLLMLEKQGFDIDSLGKKALSVLAGEAGKVQESLQVIYQFSNDPKDK
jgi:indolepyruvate ferredoxin oxidoreductase beta subunit